MSERDGRNRRTEDRIPWQIEGVRVTASRPGSDDVTFAADGHDISLNGFALRQPTFLHRDTVCRVILPSLDGRPPYEVRARAAWGCFVGERRYVCGYRAEEQLPLELLAPRSSWTPQIFRTRWTSAEIHADILCLSASEAEQSIVALTLVGRGLRVTAAGTAEEARKRLRKIHPDLVIISDDPTSRGSSLPPSTALQILQDAGFCGPVIMLAVEAPPAVEDKVWALVRKPWNPDHLRDMALEALRTIGLGGIPDVLESQLDLSSERAAAALARYVGILRTSAKQLPGSLADRDLDAIITLATSMKATGLGFGYPILSEAADAALDDIRSGGLDTARSSLAFMSHVVRKILLGTPETCAEPQAEAA